MSTEFTFLTSGGFAPDVPSGGGPPPLNPTRWSIHPSGRCFHQEGIGPVRYRGFSFFRGLDRFVRGEDIRPLVRQYDGYNVMRVWPYVDWNTDGWDAPPPHVANDFIHHVHDAFPGMQVELTVLTSDNPKRIPWALDYIEKLTLADHSNLLLEGGNEPLTNKRIEVEKLYAAMKTSGYPSASGIYEAEGQTQDILAGHYGTYHSARTYDFARRAHDAWEYFTGDGPDVRHTTGTHRPWVGDEPIRPDQITDLTHGSKVQQYTMYAAVASLLGAGATFHCEAGKQAVLMSQEEQLCSRGFLKGLLAFPADAALGAYNGTLIEPGAWADARSYPVGNYLARAYQLGMPIPSGWTPIDTDAICCRRSI